MPRTRTSTSTSKRSVRVLHEGGTVKTEDNAVVFENCDSLTMLLAADTNYLNQRDKGWRGEHPHERVTAQIAAAAKRSYAELLAEHVADYQSLYGRLSLDLGATPAAVTALPTAERVKTYCGAGQAKGGMAGRSRPGGAALSVCPLPDDQLLAARRGALPANLQGLWLYQQAAGLALRLSHRRQRADELLVHRTGQSGRVFRAAGRVDGFDPRGAQGGDPQGARRSSAAG